MGTGIPTMICIKPWEKASNVIYFGKNDGILVTFDFFACDKLTFDETVLYWVGKRGGLVEGEIR
jgi:hypothetical protein